MNFTRPQAALVMVLVTLLWSSAGVVARQLESAGSFEATFWRSLFNALFLALALSFLGRQPIWKRLRGGGRVLWASGVCWSLMYTCFMVAVTITTVANVLVTMSLAPLFAALLARWFFGQATPWRTWLAIAVAGLGIGWMYASDVAGDPRHLLGTLVALAVPVAAALNWLLIRRSGTDGQRVDLLPAIFIGACLSVLMTAPMAWSEGQATGADVAWLAALGVFQLGVPSILAVWVARGLPGAEMALLALLEVIFGVAWAWLWGGETPTRATLLGGGLVLGALAVNELVSIVRSRRPRPVVDPGAHVPS